MIDVSSLCAKQWVRKCEPAFFLHYFVIPHRGVRSSH